MPFTLTDMYLTYTSGCLHVSAMMLERAVPLSLQLSDSVIVSSYPLQITVLRAS
jgi:hypothetical protein